MKFSKWIKLMLIGATLISSLGYTATFEIDDRGVQTLEGEIDFDTTTTFSKMLHERVPMGKTLMIQSGGGLVSSALFISSIISEAKWSVIAVDFCSSACSFILFSSPDMYATEGAKIGVHAPSKPDRNGERLYAELYSDSYWRLYGTFMASGMEERKVRELLKIIYDQKTPHMRYLTEKELEYFGVKILKKK